MRKTKLTYCLLLLLLVPIREPYADGGKPDARQFVDLLRLDVQLEAAKRGCRDSVNTISPEAMQKQYPDYFGTVRPGDERWPLVVNAYKDYVEASCAHPTVEESLEIASKTYASKLSKEDLRIAIAFYSSPTGQRLVSAHREVSAALFAAMQSRQTEVTPRTMAEFQKRLSQISSAKVR